MTSRRILSTPACRRQIDALCTAYCVYAPPMFRISTIFTYLSPRVHIWSLLRLFSHCHNRGRSEPQCLPGKWGLSSNLLCPMSSLHTLESNLKFLHTGYSCPSYWLYGHWALWKHVCHKTCLFAFTLVQRVVAEAGIFRPCFGLGTLPLVAVRLLIKRIGWKMLQSEQSYIFHLVTSGLYTVSTQQTLHTFFVFCHVSEMRALRRPSLDHASPYLSKPYQTEPSGLHLSRCSAEQAGSPMKVTRKAATVVKPCLHCPHRIHQLCPADPSDLCSPGYLHLWWGSSPEPPTTQPVQMQARVPWPWPNSPE